MRLTQVMGMDQMMVKTDKTIANLQNKLVKSHQEVVAKASVKKRAIHLSGMQENR
jgi:hypothetical protein